GSLRAQAQQFVLASDLDTGAASWQHLAYEVSSLSGQRRNDLVRLLQSRKDEVDDALEGLARQRPPKAIDPEEQRRIRELQDEHRRASERYERLRERYLAAPRPGAAVPAPALVAFEHHARRFEVPLAHMLRDIRAGRISSLLLKRVFSADRHLAPAITGRLEKTLASLATADHRTLTDPH